MKKNGQKRPEWKAIVETCGFRAEKGEEINLKIKSTETKCVVVVFAKCKISSSDSFPVQKKFNENFFSFCNDELLTVV